MLDLLHELHLARMDAEYITITITINMLLMCEVKTL